MAKRKEILIHMHELILQQEGALKVSKELYRSLIEKFAREENGSYMKPDDHDSAIWNGKYFWCGAYDMASQKIVEAHSYKECEAVDFNSYWAFDSNGSGIDPEIKSDKKEWLFFWVEHGRIYLEDDAEHLNIDDGITNNIRNQIVIVNG